MSDDAIRAMVVTRAERQHMNRSEQKLFDLLTKAGITEISAQTALDKGNIDFTIESHSVAVELLGRGTRAKYRKDGWLEKRIRDAGNAGWQCVLWQ
jgi:very-short-patch-repair endonuclease